jgi:hypothetical protein
MARVSVWRQIASSSCTQCGLQLLQQEAIYIPCVLLHGSSFMEAAECGPGRQLWTSMRVSVTAYLLQGPPITEYKSQRIEHIERIGLCWVRAGMLGERGLGLVVHIPSGYVAKINIP